MPLSKEQVEHIAKLARLNLTPAEIEKFTKASVYDGVDIALREIKPIFHQNRTMIEKAREWAKLNARKANGDIEEATTEGRRLTV